MTTPRHDAQTSGLRLKTKPGWFPAGIEFRNALAILTDGAFKLFVHISLKANRYAGCYETTQIELARALGKSRRVIGKYSAELEEKGICSITRGKNQHSRNHFQISNDYWPYVRQTYSNTDEGEDAKYVAEIRDCFEALGCTHGAFSAGDIKTAKALKQDGVPIEVIRDALLLAACRKYQSWLNGSSSEPIVSLRYIEPLIAEVQKQPFAQNYREYLNAKIKQLEAAWMKESLKRFEKEGCP
jgi:biotin operon repressor